MRRAFVSHSTADDSFVAEMESFLRAAGFDEVFNDVHAIKPDEQFWPSIEQAITSCDTFVVVITAASNNSQWVKSEVALARRLRKRVIPVWREDCALPLDFTHRDVIDFRPRARKARRFDISRIVKYAPAELIGREAETAFLTESWQKVLRLEKGRPHVLTFVALGGEGKTSLVAKWAAKLADHDWPGCDAAFAWSFYHQGSEEKNADSCDLFLKEALTFFGDPATALSGQNPFMKGRRLGELITERRVLLILDGLEPLQFAPTAPMPGELKDGALAFLLTQLATGNPGLCVVSTRYSVADLRAYWETTAPELRLNRLSTAAGVTLLQSLGVTGSHDELRTLVDDVKGHALTLNLFGSYLRSAHGGDIRRRDVVRLQDANAEEQGGHAFRVMDAYVRWFETEGEKGQGALGILRLLGLFDRPLSRECLHRLLESPPITLLTELLVGMSEAQLNVILSRLETAKLLTPTRDTSQALLTIDTHPLLREYFAHALSTQRPDAWHAAHERLYEMLCDTPDKDQPTLEDLQPLYQAIMHGCAARRKRDALGEIFFDRIRRRSANYSVKRLGAISADLKAIASFFKLPWTRVSSQLTESDQRQLLKAAALTLRAAGRLGEAREAMRSLLDMPARNSAGRWRDAAILAGNLSELHLSLGKLDDAITAAEDAVKYAGIDGGHFHRILRRVTLGDALHQGGRRAEAERVFREGESLQAESPNSLPVFYGLACFRLCHLLLAPIEGAAWQQVCSAQDRSRQETVVLQTVLHTVRGRALRALEFAKQNNGSLLDVALDRLTIGRVVLYEAVLKDTSWKKAEAHLQDALDGLRQSGCMEYLPLGLLSRAWLQNVAQARTAAQKDLDEAWQIAERGPMRLHMADIHLYRARLFHSVRPYPWNRDEKLNPRGPKEDLAAARKLIEQCGYWRRKQELEDAEEAAENWPD